MTKSQRFQVVRSKFTRLQGYTEIRGTDQLQYQQAIQLLNSFTPQGASPKISLRIAYWEDKVGVGCYFMEDDENALLSTILIDQNHLDSKPLNVPISETAIEAIARGDHQQILTQSPQTSAKLTDLYSVDEASMILYSLLAGDNMIIIHPDHEQRLDFIRSMVFMMPNLFFKYNRITSGCAELDGNENIIGVSQLPLTYRSHKKLYMPLDTIFVDLQNQKVMGEGLKTSDLTKNLVRNYQEKIQLGRKSIISFFTDISQKKFTNAGRYDDQSKPLIDKIRNKLGLETNDQDNWLLSF